MEYNGRVPEGEVGMKKRGIFPVIILLVLTVGALAAARAGTSGPRPGRGQEQGERPKLYARSVVFEQNVKSSGNALGEPDGRFAEIAPGGQLVLLLEDRIYPSGSFDGGLVVVKEESHYGLEGWFLVGGTPQDPQFAWMPLVKGQSPGSFRVAVREAIEGSAGLSMIRISNADTKPILLDALVGYGRIEAGAIRPPLVVPRPLW
jgi:hypothetical protein